jgi:hypothetical protein
MEFFTRYLASHTAQVQGKHSQMDSEHRQTFFFRVELVFEHCRMAPDTTSSNFIGYTSPLSNHLIVLPFNPNWITP